MDWLGSVVINVTILTIDTVGFTLLLRIEHIVNAYFQILTKFKENFQLRQKQTWTSSINKLLTLHGCSVVLPFRHISHTSHTFQCVITWPIAFW